MLRFTSGPFFPHTNDTESPYMQCIKTDLPVFARDVNEFGSKTYFASGYNYFMEKLASRYSHLYELLRDNVPTKIFFDFDLADVSNKENFVIGINMFVNTKVLPAIESHWRPGFVPRVHYLTACTSTKLSYHVIVDFFLPDVYHVEGFIKDLHPVPEYLDMSVYGKKNQCFRLLHSYKFGKSEESALRHVDPNCQSTIMDTMIQTHKDEKVYDYSHATQPRSRRNSDTYSIDVDVDKFLKQYGEEVRASTKSGNESFDRFIVLGMICPHVKRRHVHNNTYLTINKQTMKGWFVCADKECPDTHYEEFDKALWIYL